MTTVPPVERDVCNVALGFVEHTFPIDSLDDGSPEAEECRKHFHNVRQQVLKDIQFHFSTEFLRLDGTIAAETPDTLPHVYQLPAGVLKVLKIENVDRQRWTVMGATNRLHTIHDAPILIKATVDVQDLARFEADAISAMQMLLAARIAPRFSKSQNRAEIWHKRYQDRVAASEGNEAAEGGDHLHDAAAEADWRHEITGYGVYGYGPIGHGPVYE